MENETNDNSWEQFTSNAHIKYKSKSKKYDAMFSIQIFAEILLIGIRFFGVNLLLLFILSVALFVFNIFYLVTSRNEGKLDTHVAFHRGFIACLLCIKIVTVFLLIIIFVFLANTLSSLS